jgi:hypothetical protein
MVKRAAAAGRTLVTQATSEGLLDEAAIAALLDSLAAQGPR